VIDISKSNGRQLKTENEICTETSERIAGSDVCVIIPFYNGSSFIERALKSVFYQTLQPDEVIETLKEFKNASQSLTVGNVGCGLRRALYSTYVSFLPKEKFSYQVKLYSDPRGDFVEMLRTPEAGQFSYFTAHPGVTRGGHYHHSKTEKFLVLSGTASFRFRHLRTNERYETVVRGGTGTIVDTIPGWVHDITNIGSDTLVVMLWANETFDRNRPDTIAAEM